MDIGIFTYSWVVLKAGDRQATISRASTVFLLSVSYSHQPLCLLAFERSHPILLLIPKPNPDDVRL